MKRSDKYLRKDKLWHTPVFWGVRHCGTTTHLKTQQWSHSLCRLIRQQCTRFILRQWTCCLCQCLDDGWSPPADLEPACYGSVVLFRSPLLLLGRNSVSCLLPSLTIQVPRPACSSKRILYIVSQYYINL